MYGIKWGRVDINLKPEKIVIVASGPSLTGFDFDKLRNKGYYIICVNRAAEVVTFADAWFTLDPHGFGKTQLPKFPFTGKLFAAVPEDFGLKNARILDHQCIPPKNVTYLHRMVWHSDPNLTEEDYLSWGLNEDTRCINTLNSGYGAFGLAYHYRPKKILLLGLDASHGYFYDPSCMTRSLNHLPPIFRSTLPQIEKAGIEVINGSLHSKIDCFPRCTPNSAIASF